MRVLSAILFGGALVLTPALVLAEAAERPAAQAAPALPAITVTAVQKRDMADRIIASGLIAPVEEVRVAPLIEGQPIEALLADVGDRVETGQVLAVLSKASLELQRSQSVASVASSRATIAQAEAQLLEAESSAAEAQRVAERTRRLRDQGSASQAAADTAGANAVSATARVTVARQSLEAARAQLALAEAQRANVDLMLTRTEVKAPYAGRIVERNATIGAIATAAGASMFVLEKDGELELRVDVAEGDLMRLEQGQKAIMRVSGLAEPVQGEVRLVEPAIDSATRLGRARISLGSRTNLLAGMYVEAAIIVAERQALALPVTAVSGEGAEQSVLRVLGDGMVERIAVTTGIREKGLVEIASGLTEGDVVVTKAAAFVQPGNRINPVLAASGN